MVMASVVPMCVASVALVPLTSDCPMSLCANGCGIGGTNVCGIVGNGGGIGGSGGTGSTGIGSTDVRDA